VTQGQHSEPQAVPALVGTQSPPQCQWLQQHRTRSEAAGTVVGVGAGSTVHCAGPGSAWGCREQPCNQYRSSASSCMPPACGQRDLWPGNWV